MQPKRKFRSMSSFGRWVRARRKVLGLSRRQLGERINYAEVTLTKLESGERPCTETLAELLCDALAVPAPYIAAFRWSARTGIVQATLQNLIVAKVGDTDEDPHAPAVGDSSQVSQDSRESAAHIWIQLARPAAPIFGRTAELADLLALLQRPELRLVTLIGPPGVGKSRLGEEILRQADAATWPDGKFFVPLADIDQTTLIPEAIAAAMNIRTATTQAWGEMIASQSVFRFAKDKRALLVLDNFEHLLDGIAFLTELLAAAPSIKVIVTSQVSLRLSMEQVYAVKPFEVPEGPHASAANPSVAFLVAWAQLRHPGFRLTEQNVGAVTELCQKLGGLPLALELAAARLTLLTPQALLDQFSRWPSNQSFQISQPQVLAVLKGGSRDMAARHQTLYAAIDWSYNLLSGLAQRMFEQLGVFHGGFTPEAALAVTQGSLELLEALADQSLIQVNVNEEDEIRLSLLEVFREFALLKLEARGEVDATYRRHAQYFVTRLQWVDTYPRGPGEETWLAEIGVELANIRAALAWCVKHDVPTGFALARYMSYYWLVFGYHSESRAWISQLLEAGTHQPEGAITPAMRAYLLCNSVLLYVGTPISVLEEQIEVFRQLDDKAGLALANGMVGFALSTRAPAAAELYLVDAIAFAKADGRFPWNVPFLQLLLGICLYNQGKFAASEAMLHESIRGYTALQDWHNVTRTQAYLGWLLFLRGDYEAVLVVTLQALPFAQRSKDAYGLVSFLTHQTAAEIELGRLAEARVTLAEGLRVMEETNVDTLQPRLLHVAGTLAFREGKPREAFVLYQQSNATAQRIAQPESIRFNLIRLAEIALTDPAHAHAVVTWLSAVKVDIDQRNYRLAVSYEASLNALLHRATAQLPPAAVAEAQAEGQGLSLAGAVVLAQSTAHALVTGA